ncbi:hypothetical protein Hte_007095 [Hypoxylon texense]
MVSSTGRLVPSVVKANLPLDRETRQHVEHGRESVKRLLANPQGDDRLLVIIGPCSVHDTTATLEYTRRLAEAAQKHRDQLLIVMRVYIEKPRTTVGWKGLVHDPDLTQSTESNLIKGILLSRHIMLAVAKTGLPIVTEILSPLLAPFIQDVLSMGVIGARTTESQTHRELSSDLSIPMGFKNGTDGTLKAAIDAMTAASRPHTILGVDDNGHLVPRLSSGNADTFVILRGGSCGPNYSSEHVRDAEASLLKSGKDARVVIDCSHGNSSKDYRNQSKVAASIAAQVSVGSNITGVMIESNINEGRQDIPANPSKDLAYGVSVTDGCVGWEETEKILDMLSLAVQQRRLTRKELPGEAAPVPSLFHQEVVTNEKMCDVLVHTNGVSAETY